IPLERKTPATLPVKHHRLLNRSDKAAAPDEELLLRWGLDEAPDPASATWFGYAAPYTSPGDPLVRGPGRSIDHDQLLLDSGLRLDVGEKGFENTGFAHQRRAQHARGIPLSLE